VFALFTATALALGGGCHSPVVGPVCHGEHQCKANSDCGKDLYCDTKTSCCVDATRSCGMGADAGLPAGAQTNPCCPGQICSDLAGQCADSYTPCSTDADCTAPQYCDQTLGVRPSGLGCTYHTCTADSDCAKYGGALSCFNSYCVSGPPCGMGCAAGTVCTPVNNFCYPLGMNPSASCQQSCGAGSILVFSDGSNVFDFCNWSETANCQCLALPNIPALDTARYSSAALTNAKQIVVSAYDTDHGDLVLHTFDESTLAEIQGSPVWIDGVPTTGTVTGNPNGPRGGLADPGPDVGRYTSIVYDPTRDTIHIAYYGVKNGSTPLQDLRYARRIGSGFWTTEVVDGSDAQGASNGADVGMYASITLAPDGSPVIAYYQRTGTGANAAQTALKVARAVNPTPMTAGDWLLTVVETGTRTLPPCGGQACPMNQVCTATSAAPNGACVAQTSMASACSPACGSKQACVLNSSNTPTCVDTLSTSVVADLTDGDGLMPSIAYLDSVPAVVWYDHQSIGGKPAGVLKGIIASADANTQSNQPPRFDSGSIVILDDGTVPGSSAAAHDVGRFPSLAIAPSGSSPRIAVSYMDATNRQTLLLTADSGWARLTTQGQRTVDTGAGTPTGDPSLFVGANTSTKFVGGHLFTIYQDSTGLALRMGTQSSATTPVVYTQAISQMGAAGFYGSMVVDGTNRFASNAIIAAKNQTQSANRLTVVKLP
jgi:hypothetical protein